MSSRELRIPPLVATFDEMSTAKSEEKMSRRSSILKPAKSRQPLQNVELNTTSTENSPATSTFKIKRRVSFAEKKHVKEFCDSMEQGTVWDNTYEESELSHKISHSSNSDENTATAEFSDKSSKNVFPMNVAPGKVHVSVLHELDMVDGTLKDLSPVNTQNKSNFDLHWSGPQCDPVMEDFTFNALPTNIPHPTCHMESIKARRSLSVNDCFAGQSAIDENTPFRVRSDSCPATMDSRTLQVTHVDSSNSELTKTAREDCNDAPLVEKTIIGNVSIKSRPIAEIAAVSTRPPIIAFGKKHSISDTAVILSDEPLVDDAKFNEESPGIVNNSVPQEKFTIFHDTSMEITEAVSNFVKTCQPVKSLTLESMLGTKDMQEAVSTVERRSIVGFVDEGPILDAAVISSTESIIDNAKLEGESPEVAKHSVEQEKFTIFHDTSMEITEAVSNFGKARQPATLLNLEPREESSLVTAGCLTMPGTEAMNFTEVKSKIVGHPGFNEFNSRQPDLHTDLHRDKSMDFTEVVRTTSGIGRSQVPTTEKTTIFHDKSVDFTEIVENIPFIEKPRKSTPERTTLFHDKFLEFTDVVQNIPIVKYGQRSSMEKTTIFHDKSVDFTKIVDNGSCIEKSEKLPTERTTLFHNKSLEFTNVVENISIIKQRPKSPTERTTIFHDEVVDFTEVVRNVPYMDKIVEKSCTDDPRPAVSSIFDDRSEAPVDAIEKSRLDGSSEKPEAKEKSLVKNRQSELPKHVQIMSKLHCQSSLDNLKEKIASVVKSLPAIQKPLPMSPELEVRSPLRKRMKSLPNDSIAFTAALPFVLLQRKKKTDHEATVASEVNDEQSLKKNTTSHSRSMELTEAVTELFSREQHPVRNICSSPRDEIPIIHDETDKTLTTCAPVDSAEHNCDDDSRRVLDTTTVNDQSMEMTTALPGIMRAEIIEAQENPETTSFHDQSMEMTVAVSRSALSRAIPTSSENRSRDIPDNSEAKSVIFHDDCMELTGVVQYQLPNSSAKERIYACEDEVANSHWNDPKKIDADGKTVIFRNDCMELTSAVQYTLNTKDRICTNENEIAKRHWNDSVKLINDRKTTVSHDDYAKPAIVDKENCPVGKEDFRPRAVRLFESESRIADSKSEWLEKRKPSRSLSSHKNYDNLQGQAMSDEQGRVENYGSDDITGVVAFSSQIDNKHEVDYQTSENNRASILGNEELEMTGVVPWKSDLDCGNRPARSLDSSRSVAAADNLPTDNKSQQRSSQVAKELFQKSISSKACAAENIPPVIVNDRAGTADLEAEIRKLAESFDVEDESGFDQATFLRQQARCMEDYEANSTASQDCDPAALSVRTDALSMKRSVESPNFEKSADCSPNLKMDNITSKSQCFSSKSLEELRCRAYSVSKFEHSFVVPENENFHNTVMLEDLQAVEPPSFLGDLADSVQSSRSVSELPNELQSSDDIPNATLLELPIIDITQTLNMEGNVNEKKNDHAGERTERKETRRSKTYVMKKSIHDAPTSISSPLQIDVVFEPEAIGCELNTSSSIPNSEHFYESNMLENLQAVKPPSFLADLAESVQSTRFTAELPTESKADGKITDGETCPKTISRISENMPNTSELTIPDITQTEKYTNETVNETENDSNSERKEIRSSQANTVKKRVYDEPISITSSQEVDEETPKNRRHSSTGVTSAAEFSSASPNGPSEKLRRVDNMLPTDCKEEKLTNLASTGCPWDCKNFASSTVIVDDLTRQSADLCAHETPALLQNFSPDELPSVISTCEQENAVRSFYVKEVALEPEVSMAKRPFDVFKEKIYNLAERLETIWEINLFTDKILALCFFSNSIVLAIHFNENMDECSTPIKAIGFLSQLIEDGTDPGVSLAHSLIMKKVEAASFMRSCRSYEDIPELLDFVTTEVKLGMDFMFELDHLRNLNVMGIHGNRIDFIVRTRDINAGIILKLTMTIKPFAEINPNDVTISCILGSDKIRENDIKRLITNVKRDHSFLRYYMNDVMDYVDLMAETGFSASSGTHRD